jgi:hypothetical protein
MLGTHYIITLLYSIMPGIIFPQPWESCVSKISVTQSKHNTLGPWLYCLKMHFRTVTKWRHFRFLQNAGKCCTKISLNSYLSWWLVRSIFAIRSRPRPREETLFTSATPHVARHIKSDFSSLPQLA